LSYIKSAYNTWLRPHLPRKLGLFNGVVVRQPKLLDRMDVQPDYERTCVKHTRNSVQPGDTVVSVGGGCGVSQVHAANAAGPGGEVIVYEASPDIAEKVRETVELNDPAAPIEVRAQAVGDSEVRWGGEPVDTLHPADLPTADVLELDCEGAELDIIPHLEPERYPTVVCETHGFLGAGRDRVTRLFREQRYRVAIGGCDDVERDIAILVATPNPPEVETNA